MMLSLSRKTILALEAVIDVAMHARPDPVQARDITERQNVPQRYLEQVMQALVRADILRGVRGPRGGYRLARERRRISAGEIVRVIAEMDSDEENTAPNGIGAGATAAICGELETELMSRLDNISIAELCDRQDHSPTQSGAKTTMDFTI